MGGRDNRLEVWTRRARALDQKLKPIVSAPVDINAPDWEAQLAAAPHPVDEAGVRGEVERFFDEVVSAYGSISADERQQLNQLMAGYGSLMYSAVLPDDPDPLDRFRRKLILMVIDDQGQDPRDAIVALGQYRKDGEKLGIDVDAVFREMAALASTVDKYGWGSTQALFTRA